MRWAGSKSAMRNKGFTLLETVVALAIIAIALAAAVRSLHYATETVGDLATRTAAAWVAQNAVNEVLASRSFPPLGTASGQASQGSRVFVWRQEVGATPNAAFRRLETTVYAAERPEHALARLVSYVARQPD